MFSNNRQLNVLQLSARLALLLFCLSTVWQPMLTFAQDESLSELKQKSNDLIKRQRYTEALPILEKLVIAEPDNPETHFFLGFALLAQANITKDDASRKALRIQARA